MGTSKPPAASRGISVRALALFTLLVLTAIFCFMNYDKVMIWPFKSNVPKFIVILLSVLLGFGVGWIGRGIVASRHARDKNHSSAQTS